jgi:hypothetical protein
MLIVVAPKNDNFYEGLAWRRKENKNPLFIGEMIGQMIVQKINSNIKEATVNKTLDGSTYPG